MQATKYGIVPTYCDHESLCKTISALPTELLQDRQIIQVGHWTSSRRCLQSCFTIGNYEIQGSYFDDAIIVCTENDDGAAFALMQTANRPPYNHEPFETLGLKRRRGKVRQSYVPSDTTRKNRSSQMVWFAATLETQEHSPEFPIFQDGPPSTSTRIRLDAFNVYYWPSTRSLIQQKPANANHSLSWHLLVKRGTFHGYPGLPPSELFNRRRNYWAESINAKGIAESPDDWAMPKNTVEESLGPQQICESCANALDGPTEIAHAFSGSLASGPTVVCPPGPSLQQDTVDDAATELIEVDSIFHIAPSLRSIYDNLLYVLTLKRNV